MNLSAQWIWIDKVTDYMKKVGHFKRSFRLERVPAQWDVAVSAESVYRLYVNGSLVVRGPCKGDLQRKYVDRVDLAPYLQTGLNTIAAVVVYFPNESVGNQRFHNGPTSIVSQSIGGFMLADLSFGQDDPDADAAARSISTDGRWLAMRNAAYAFVEASAAKYAGDMEHVDGNLYPFGWESASELAAAGALEPEGLGMWRPATVVGSAVSALRGGLQNLWPLHERTIPQQRETDIRFARIVRSGGQAVNWHAMLDGKEVEIPPGSTAWTELDVGALTTAYVRLRMRVPQSARPLPSAERAQVRLIYAESYIRGFDAQGWAIKERRDDADGGFLHGESDLYSAGAGSGEQLFAPLLYRTFRFIRLEAASGERPLTISGLSLRETGYPLHIEAQWRTPGEEWRKLWDISVRTLQRCMHDTYIDSPYYEQMQYTMDSMLQMLFTYKLSRDDRLARKAIDDFHCSLMPDGMLTCNWPAKFRQIIPGFALYWIMMLEDHYMHFGDAGFVAKYLPTAAHVLRYFDERIDKESGLVADIGYWQFVDWTEAWTGTFGSPIAGHERFHTIYNMMYIYALRVLSRLHRAMGQADSAGQLEERARAATDAVVRHTWDEAAGLFRDTPQADRYSQHAQVWAVLAGIVGNDSGVSPAAEPAVRYANARRRSAVTAQSLMRSTLDDPRLARCSYAMSYFLFRALEQANAYRWTEPLWKQWKDLAVKQVTTWPEDPVTERSDCHGWGSLPLYEFTACIIGVVPRRPGFAELLIKPETAYFASASGVVATVQGPVDVSWKRDGDIFMLEAFLPAPLRTEVRFPDGSTEMIEDRRQFRLERRLLPVNQMQEG